MFGRREDRNGPAAHFGGDVGAQGADSRGGRDDGGEDVPGQSQAFEQFGGPGALHGSYNWLVVAMLNSVDFTPVNQKLSRSGIIRRVSAASRSGDCLVQREELEERVELQELDAGAVEDRSRGRGCSNAASSMPTLA